MTAKSKTTTHRPTERPVKSAKPVVKRAANALKNIAKKAKKPE